MEAFEGGSSEAGCSTQPLKKTFGIFSNAKNLYIVKY